MTRYTNTTLNKNRRRAAAVFRIFLCDPLFPAIESTIKKSNESFLDSTFVDEHSQFTEEDIKKISQMAGDARHGQDALCMSCHSKLDPLGQTFAASSISLNSKPSKGALYFKRGNHTINIPVRGIGELAQKITEQPEYVDCQIQWFWNEFIGTDVPLNPTTQKELRLNFERVGRKTNDFIRYLVKRPEFIHPPQPLDILNPTFSMVKPLLQRCDSCHTDAADEGYLIPSFSQLPISSLSQSEGQSSKDIEINQSCWLNNIKNRLFDLSVKPKKRMPKDPENWNSSDLELLKRWLEQGAKDDNGKFLLKNELPFDQSCHSNKKREL